MMTDNSNTDIDIKKYLVTQKSDLQSFSEEKINKDLDAITKSELRSKERAGITMGKKEDAVTRAISALGLINPFKGV